MSHVSGPARWKCDRCDCDGGVVNEDHTIPPRWLSLRVLVGAPQIAEEARTDRIVHLCGTCGGHFLFDQIIGKSHDIERLRQIYKRELAETRATS